MLRTWTTISFFIGVFSLLSAHLIDSLATDAGLTDLRPYLHVYLMSGVAFAICSVPTFRVPFTQSAETGATIKGSLSASTFAFVLFLAPTLLLVPQIPARWLLYSYAFAILFNWFAWRFLWLHLPLPSFRSTRFAAFAAYSESMPHALFIIAALFLLALTPLYLFVNQHLSAERMANWAYGFLVLGITIAVFRLVPMPDRIRVWNQRFPQVVVGLLLFSFLIVGHLIAQLRHTIPEATLIVDVNPNYLANRVGNGDIVISDSPQLRLSNIPGIAPYLDLQPDQRGIALWDDLIRLLADKRRVFWVSVPGGSRDQQAILATFLKTNGCLDDIPNTPLPVRLYEMRTPLLRPRVLPPSLSQRVPDAFDPAQVDFGPLQIIGFRHESIVCSHDAVAVAIRWRLIQPPPDSFKLSLFLMDARGRQIQIQDDFITDAELRYTNQWTADQESDGYYRFPIPLGTPPGKYTIAAAVYSSGDQQRLRVLRASGVAASFPHYVILGQVQVYRPNDLKADPYETLQESALMPAKVELRTGLRLVAYGVNSQSVLPGENLQVTARWRALLDSLPSYIVRVRLVQGDQVIAQVAGIPVDNTYPTDQWRADEVVVDHWDVRVPPETKGGTARLEIGLDGGKTLYLADVDIAEIKHTFQIPNPNYAHRASFSGVADLVGYDLDRTQITADGSLGLMLYWRASAPAPLDKNYVVFAQLLAPGGELIAQSDRQPANAQRPTRSWIPTEFIPDTHTLTLGDTTYRGDAALVVGLYDPETLERVAVVGGQGDFTKLATSVRVVSR